MNADEIAMRMRRQRRRLLVALALIILADALLCLATYHLT